MTKKINNYTHCEFCKAEKPYEVLEVFGREKKIYLDCACEQALTAKKEAEKAAEADRAAEVHRLLQQRLNSAGIPARFQFLPAGAERKDFIADYISSFSGGTGLYIFGPVGRGKTYFAAQIAQAAIEAGHRTVFRYSPDLFREIRDCFNSGTRSSKTIMDRNTKCRLLVIDDLGKESQSTWTIQTLSEIINGRYASLLPTIITSQYALSETTSRIAKATDEQMADAITSRIFETSRLLGLNGKNKRLISEAHTSQSNTATQSLITAGLASSQLGIVGGQTQALCERKEGHENEQ